MFPPGIPSISICVVQTLPDIPKFIPDVYKRQREELALMADGPELDLLIRNLNLTAYGADMMYRDRGILSDYGYVHRPDGQPMHLPQQGMDITCLLYTSRTGKIW